MQRLLLLLNNAAESGRRWGALLLAVVGDTVDANVALGGDPQWRLDAFLAPWRAGEQLVIGARAIGRDGLCAGPAVVAARGFIVTTFTWV